MKELNFTHKIMQWAENLSRLMAGFERQNVAGANKIWIESSLSLFSDGEGFKSIRVPYRKLWVFK